MASSPPKVTALRTLRLEPQRRRALPKLEVTRSRPRSYEEWSALSRWRKLPEWERGVPGYLLRSARERSGLTQAELASALGVSQQAVARAERWESNPTVRFLEVWADALGARLELRLEPAAIEDD